MMTNDTETISSQALTQDDFDFEWLPGEQWKHVQGASRYAISNMGRAASNAWAWRAADFRRNPGAVKFKELSYSVRNREKGYFVVSIGYDNGKRRLEVLHRLVALAFVPNPHPAEWDVVRHIKALSLGGSNHADNLEWGTQAHNIQDSIRDGTLARGTRNGNSKFTDEQVREVRRLHAEGNAIRAIARHYNVSQFAIQSIVRRRSYAHLSD